jgi:hypothetical protein
MSQIINGFSIFQPESLEQLYDWILEAVLPAISGRVLETESGTGIFTAKLIQRNFNVELNASTEANRAYLRKKFKNDPRVRAVHLIHFRTQPQMEHKYIKAKNRFPTVVAIGDIATCGFYERPSIEKAKQFLSAEGHIIISCRCGVDIYPGSQPDPEIITDNTFPYIANLLTDCELLMVKYFNWNGLSFMAVGRKVLSEIE